MLQLYSAPYCHYCKRVEAFFDEDNIPYEKKDVSDPLIRDELIQKGGKMQIPYLVDTERDVAMYESDDIIQYAAEQYGAKKAR